MRVFHSSSYFFLWISSFFLVYQPLILFSFVLAFLCLLEILFIVSIPSFSHLLQVYHQRVLSHCDHLFHNSWWQQDCVKWPIESLDCPLRISKHILAKFYYRDMSFSLRERMPGLKLNERVLPVHSKLHADRHLWEGSKHSSRI